MSPFGVGFYDVRDGHFAGLLAIGGKLDNRHHCWSACGGDRLRLKKRSAAQAPEGRTADCARGRYDERAPAELGNSGFIR
jgi:hypothetical protein